jgi:hypothetical protein
MKFKTMLSAVVLAASGFAALAPAAVSASTVYLVLGTYAQGDGGKPRIAIKTSPSVHSIPFETMEQCEVAGRQIHEIIYKPVWYLDGRWTCVNGK